MILLILFLYLLFPLFSSLHFLSRKLELQQSRGKWTRVCPRGNKSPEMGVKLPRFPYPLQTSPASCLTIRERPCPPRPKLRARKNCRPLTNTNIIHLPISRLKHENQTRPKTPKHIKSLLKLNNL